MADQTLSARREPANGIVVFNPEIDVVCERYAGVPLYGGPRPMRIVGPLGAVRLTGPRALELADRIRAAALARRPTTTREA